MPTEVGWGKHYYYPRAIVHVDGDGFFAACEVARDPTLRGKPVVTGKERGIVSAATYEAKRRGITRGVPLKDVKRICPEAIIISSDYQLYTLYSLRMYEIMRRYTPEVEEYGIDECFGDITGLRRVHHKSYEEIARAIKDDLHRELDITFSVGLSCTKVLAKIGSNYRKPDGFTAIPLLGKDAFLSTVPVEKVWGIGANTGALLRKHGVQTAGEFANKNEAWVRARVTKPILELWKELNGESVFPLTTEQKEDYHSIQKTRTFSPASDNPAFLYSELSKNIEGASRKARRYNLVATGLSFFLKSSEFQYRTHAVTLPRPTNVPSEILHALEPFFAKVYRRGTRYRTTGITLTGLREAKPEQLDLFVPPERSEGMDRLFERVDELTEKYGRDTVYLGSSAEAVAARRKAAEGDGIGSVSKYRPASLFEGKRRLKLFSLPVLGDVM
ncbi:MAG TPA: DNA polymerase IV [Candidatus Paceibacterota bacterium]|nr:DNA polymerase IV [Candidatus Paceibacterota bacterium]